MSNSQQKINWRVIHNAINYVIFGYIVLGCAGLVTGEPALIIAAVLCAFGTIKIKSALPSITTVGQVIPASTTQEVGAENFAEEYGVEPYDNEIALNEPSIIEPIELEPTVQSEEIVRETVMPKRATAPKSKMNVPALNWEEWVGQKLLQKLGVGIVLIGMIVFLKYSFDNGWIGPHGRIALSVLASVALLVAGEWFQKKYPQWFQAFTGGGLALLYFTVWAAHVYYADSLAFAVTPLMAGILYSAITAIGALASIRYQAQTIAWFTVVGGYTTPLLLQGVSDPVALIVYLAILAAGLLALAWYQKWRNINLVAFVVTQLYLWGKIYILSEVQFTDTQQVVVASGFFMLFGILPLLYQFMLGSSTEPDDIVLVVINALVVLSAVVNVIGFSSPYMPIVYLVLATIYLAFAALALQKRTEDNLLINTYLVGTIGLVAAAIYAELTYEFVAAGWAPFSALLVLVTARLQRTGPWVCAFFLLLASLLFLAIQIPGASNVQEIIVWRPFTSSWSVQSYIVFLCLTYWLYQAKRLPQSVLTEASKVQLSSFIHSILALLLFVYMSLVAFSYGVPALDWQFDSVLTIAHMLFAAIAIGVFISSGALVWFIASCFAQILVIASIFFLSDSSGLLLYGSSASVVPFIHPWSLLSVLSLVITAALGMAVTMHPQKFVHTSVATFIMTAAILLQVWVHVSLEIWHIAQLFDWSTITFIRVVGVWWILFSIAMQLYAMLKKNLTLQRLGLLALAPAVIKDAAYMVEKSTSMYEIIVWSGIAIALGVYALYNKDKLTLYWSVAIAAIFVVVSTFAGYTVDFTYVIWWSLIAFVLTILGTRLRSDEYMYSGMGILIFTAGYNMLLNITGSSQAFVNTIWWALIALITVGLGFSERKQQLRKLGIAMFMLTTVKLLLFDFASLHTGVRIAASIIIGLLMILASYLYQRFDSLLQDS